jgi:hypothetical protein
MLISDRSGWGLPKSWTWIIIIIIFLFILIYLLFYDQVKFHTAIGRSQLSEHDDVSHLIL